MAGPALAEVDWIQDQWDIAGGSKGPDTSWITLTEVGGLQRWEKALYYPILGGVGAALLAGFGWALWQIIVQPL